MLMFLESIMLEGIEPAIICTPSTPTRLAQYLIINPYCKNSADRAVDRMHLWQTWLPGYKSRTKHLGTEVLSCQGHTIVWLFFFQERQTYFEAASGEDVYAGGPMLRGRTYSSPYGRTMPGSK